MILYYMQGDCLLKRCGNFKEFKNNFAKIPEKAKKLKTNLVLKGATNSHALYGGEFVLSEYDGTLFLEVIEETVLDHVKDHNSITPIHAEHHAQKIEKGQYFLSPLMEYDHLKE